MDNNKQQQEFVDIIQQNEKKSRVRFISWIVLCLALGLLTIYYGYESQQKSKLLFEQAEKLESQAAALEESRKDVTAAKDSLRVLLSKIENQVTDPAIKAEIKKGVTNTATAGYIIYIQEFGSRGGDVSKKIQNNLKQKGYSVPGIERMKVDFKSRITYFHEEDAKIAFLIYEEISKIIRELDSNYNLELLKPKKSNLKSPSKQIEIWINI